MVRPYSQDLGSRVIAAVEEESLLRREAARPWLFGQTAAMFLSSVPDKTPMATPDRRVSDLRSACRIGRAVRVDRE